jgi:hypothetical protein
VAGCFYKGRLEGWMKKMILGLFVTGILSIFAHEGHAQVAMNLKNQKKYQREHTPGLLPQKKLRKHDFYSKPDSKPAYETGSIPYEKSMKKEKKHTSKIAARHMKPPKLSTRVKEKDKVGI